MRVCLMWQSDCLFLYQYPEDTMLLKCTFFTSDTYGTIINTQADVSKPENSFRGGITLRMPAVSAEPVMKSVPFPP